MRMGQLNVWVWLQIKLLCMHFHTCMRPCVCNRLREFMNVHQLGRQLALFRGDSSCHTVAAWFHERGKSSVPKDRLCPAVLTMNVTLASNQRVKSLPARILGPQLYLLPKCQQ